MASATSDPVPSLGADSFATGEGSDWPVASLDIRDLHYAGNVPECLTISIETTRNDQRPHYAPFQLAGLRATNPPARLKN
jgi:hypothetical protein